ncbi:hypothetical protein FGO68_gene16255 [Halteria grandinella]|uniref:Uncharacterized protein n=1 Tax=Halteria grandinella TaxID=5974 RepID=A0A8J8NHQ4_HALGN|nr:hypothetical protein FGO68_gene16255 [Halteria grandinella]
MFISSAIYLEIMLINKNNEMKQTKPKNLSCQIQKRQFNRVLQYSEDSKQYSQRMKSGQDLIQKFLNFFVMCIYKLGRMKANSKMIKHLSWCFNQNNVAKKVDSFLSKLQGISENLNRQNYPSENDDTKPFYREILEINRQNIKVFGLAFMEKTWKGSDYVEQFKNSKKLIQTNHMFKKLMIMEQNTFKIF